MDAVRFLVVVEYLDISVAVCTAFKCNAKFGLWTLLDLGARFRLFGRTAQQACTHLIALFRELACARPDTLATRLGALAPRAPPIWIRSCRRRVLALAAARRASNSTRRQRFRVEVALTTALALTRSCTARVLTHRACEAQVGLLAASIAHRDADANTILHLLHDATQALLTTSGLVAVLSSGAHAAAASRCSATNCVRADDELARRALSARAAIEA